LIFVEGLGLNLRGRFGYACGRMRNRSVILARVDVKILGVGIVVIF
jgi:hypothetical protein